MSYKISFIVTEKYDPLRKELGLKVSLSGFSAFKGCKIKFTAFPPQEGTFSANGSITFSTIGTPGNNSLEIIDKKSSRILQTIGSLNGNIFTEGDKGQEIIITHESKKAKIELKKVASLKNELLRLDAAPKISLFFGLDTTTNQPIYTTKVDGKGSIICDLVGPMSEKHEIRVLTSQMTKIVSIKPPET